MSTEPQETSGEVVEPVDAGGTVWDAPNQQVVRADTSAPWDEGTGGVPGTLEQQAADETPPGTEPGDDLEAMTKTELLDYAKRLGVSPANNAMTKDELIDSIEAHRG